MRKANLVVIGFCVIILSDSVFGGLKVFFDDGEDHIINTSKYQNDYIYLDSKTANNPGTHFELAEGGVISGIYAHSSSIVTIDGGSVNGYLFTYDNSHVEIRSGLVNNWLDADDYSTVVVDGGSIGGNLQVNNNGIIHVKGGTVGYRLVATGGTMYLYGSDFSVNGQMLKYGDNLRDYATLITSPNKELVGRITGTLQNGTALNNDFRILPRGGDIIIIPEPVSLALLTLGGLLIRIRA
jgi:hypothetical protein